MQIKIEGEINFDHSLNDILEGVGIFKKDFIEKSTKFFQSHIGPDKKIKITKIIEDICAQKDFIAIEKIMLIFELGMRCERESMKASGIPFIIKVPHAPPGPSSQNCH